MDWIEAVVYLVKILSQQRDSIIYVRIRKNSIFYVRISKRPQIQRKNKRRGVYNKAAVMK